MTFDLSKPFELRDYVIEIENVEAVAGTQFEDTFVGSNNDDVYFAGAGGHDIKGNGGSDRLVGSYRAEDALSTEKRRTSSGKKIDIIEGFDHNLDYFDLSALHPTKKNDKFKFVDEGDLKKAGDLRFYGHNERGTANDYTMIEANFDKKGGPDFSIKILGLVDLGTADFIL